MRPVWCGHRAAAIALLVAVTSTACLSPPERQSYQVHPGAPLPAGEVVVVLLGDALVARFDGLTAVRGDWTEVRLKPGTHRIQWTERAPEGSSPQTDLAWLSGADCFEVALEAGHTYSLRKRGDGGIVDETTARPVPTRPCEGP
jgi:hypothetical protein